MAESKVSGKENSAEEEQHEKDDLPSLKKNNLNTKNIPPLMMLFAGLITFIICWACGYEIHTFLFVVLIAMLVFAIIGTVIKTVVDSFNMNMTYEDLLEDDEYDEGEIVEK